MNIDLDKKHITSFAHFLAQKYLSGMDLVDLVPGVMDLRKEDEDYIKEYFRWYWKKALDLIPLDEIRKHYLARLDTMCEEHDRRYMENLDELINLCYWCAQFDSFLQPELYEKERIKS